MFQDLSNGIKKQPFWNVWAGILAVSLPHCVVLGYLFVPQFHLVSQDS